MINILLVEDDLSFCQKIITTICITNINFRIAGIACTKNDFLYLTSNQQIDIILVDIKKYNSTQFNQVIKKHNYKTSIILMLNNQNEIDFKFNTPYIYDYILKKNINDELLLKIISLIYSRFSFKLYNPSLENKIRKLITNELKKIGYNFTYVGTKYLLETVYILYSLKNYYYDNLERDIYTIVAKKYKKNAHNIKCNIRNATDIMYYENEETKISNYIGNCKIFKPSANRIIYSILSKI